MVWIGVNWVKIGQHGTNESKWRRRKNIIFWAQAKPCSDFKFAAKPQPRSNVLSRASLLHYCKISVRSWNETFVKSWWSGELNSTAQKKPMLIGTLKLWLILLFYIQCYVSNVTCEVLHVKCCKSNVKFYTHHSFPNNSVYWLCNIHKSIHWIRLVHLFNHYRLLSLFYLVF